MVSDTAAAPSFPRQRARTRNFTSGAPRSFRVDPTGQRVLFLRSSAGDDRVAALWRYDVTAADEQLLVDPRAFGSGDEHIPAEERARRERARESAGGVVAYAVDDAFAQASFALAGRLHVVDIDSGELRSLPTAGDVFDPRLDPTGARIAYVTGGALHVVNNDGSGDVCIAADEDDAVVWGMAEFVAAEEISRFRGYWWTPDGRRIVAARVDENAVLEWHVSDPANPEQAATVLRYPRAGTANADVTLHVLDLDGRCVDIDWDRAALPYVVHVQPQAERCLVAVQSRDQRRLVTLDADLQSGRTTVVHEQTDDNWVAVVRDLPARLADGRLVATADGDESRRLCIDDEAITPAGWQVAAADVVGAEIVVAATDDPTQRHVWFIDAAGARRVTHEPGLHTAAYGGGTFVVASASMDHHGARVTVQRDGAVVGAIASRAEEPVLTPTVTFLTTGRRELRSAVVLPSGHERGVRLPVLLDPYAGPLPGVGRVARSRAVHLTAQWFADQGFAVVATDGRGTWGRGPVWERAIVDDWANTVLDDQVDALKAVAESMPDLDLERVAIRGWSFGGYLAALAVLRRPDVFHAAVAGAPVTDWMLYDTHYTERYLGDPNVDPGRYAAASLIDDAAKLQRPLLLVHGLADDNVLAAHTLRLSSALLAAGRPHSVLPLPGLTHMAVNEAVEENLLTIEVEFFRSAFSLAASRG